MNSYKFEFAQFLIREQALQFGQFTLKSGRVSPYFFNSARFNTGRALRELGEFYARAIADHLPGCTSVFGPAYKGIPLCIATAQALEIFSNQTIGYFFNRKEKKSHGDAGRLVGRTPTPEDRIVMVDDVITDGLTKLEAVVMVRETCGVEFAGIVVAVDRMERNQSGQDALLSLEERVGVPVRALINIREVCELLTDVEVDSAVVLDVTKREQIETYLRQHGAQDR
ncbi:MAG: orotate phosphoribosyltransferase [SAR324 cluster bacterium]|jgi:orotate phosphoribosyltransferase|nr:orotate phosphoribosyltransferase [Deltaproteobacteria bacterium]MDE0906302.1 orotate phosphoribosyltransferase [SAR324 cluster bacterium]HIF70185.1 orotate phosphoribosyltransferase [Candidatus Lambdaproteobacteria bacterium]MEC7417100.1 orotate phosphoribosyltransferase [SAR324 cluster bacterium]HBI29913.1 orotate phosphoribosyltransferase [Deltaproteobacteria bacterium]|tara:strand:+ start:249 stop:926 length:678 start_codon:yes stop_codon:yes gene_type:complete